MAQIKVIHLELDGEHYYFGSPKAMFDIMGKEKMGMSYNSFHSNIHLKIGEPYYNRRRGYTIRVGILGQAKTNRSNNFKSLLKAAEEIVEKAEGQVATPVASTPEPMVPKRKKKDKKDVPEQLTLF